jgi:poly(A) polymerase
MFDVPQIALDLGEIFNDAGFELALVGGPVRDILLKRPLTDLDFTSNATPDEVKVLLNTYLDDLWDVGKEFGTIGGNKYTPIIDENGDPVLDDEGNPKRETMQVEVTTYRTDEYDPKSRKPVVKYGDTLEADLSRRDFTVNSIALRLPALELVDPFMGISDLTAQILRTPIEPQKSFDDDPLRMMRAVRFVSTLGFKIESNTAQAIFELRDRLEIISKERIRDEFSKLMMSPNPRRGIEEMIGFGLNAYVVPEIEDLMMEIDPAHHHKDVFEHSLKVLENAMTYEEKYLGGPDLVIRFAALLHDIAKPKTRRFLGNGKVTFRYHDVEGAKMVKSIMKRLRFDKKSITSVAKLVELHMRFYGYGEDKWTDQAIRRYAVDAGEELNRLHVLTRSDVTTQNQMKANYLANAYDDIEARIEGVREEEEIGKIRPDLNGLEIIEILNIDQSKKDERKFIGKAYNYLLNYRLENGGVDKEVAKDLLINWAKEEGILK